MTHITNDADLQPWIPHHQFGFRKAHSTIQQCHRITDAIHKALDDQQYCPAVFLVISQAFDKVWHPGLLYKLNISYLSVTFKSYDPTYSAEPTTLSSTLPHPPLTPYNRVSPRVAYWVPCYTPYTHRTSHYQHIPLPALSRMTPDSSKNT